MNKGKRSANFQHSEKIHLFNIIVNKYSHVIEDKKTDRVSCSKKEKAWQAIEKEFNATSSSTVYRNANNLKKLYENKKKELRKSLSEERKETMLTGRGPPPKIKKDICDEMLMSIVNKKTLVGMVNEYDDDADDSLILMNDAENTVEFTFHDMNDTSLKVDTPDTSAHSTAEILQDVTFPNWKKYTPVQLQAPVHNLLTVKKEHNEENNEDIFENSVKTPKRSNRRRPTTIVKTLTSSDLAKKYDLLLDKRLALVDEQLKHMKRENSLLIQKRELEIKLLERQLSNS